MSLDQHKSLVQGAFDAFNAQDLGAAVDVCTEDVRGQLQQHLDTMPWVDYRVEITEMIAEGNRVVAVITTQGVHAAAYHGIPPTGKHFTNQGAVIFRVEGGRLSAMESHIDSLGVVTQLGGSVVPRLPGS